MKKELAQYFTVKAWKTSYVNDFINKFKHLGVLDPFAGNGDLINEYNDHIGMDIDKSLGWEYNDSLKHINHTDRLIITNPPYMARNSATKNKSDFMKYFLNNKYEDIYMLALEKCLQSSYYVVAIIPETFINNLTKL